ncbi:hypothetical protein VTI74DRAFT_177 [Chaetomium olivicolor]
MWDFQFSVLLTILATLAVNAAELDRNLNFDLLLRRQTPGTPQFECHSNCGNALAGGRIPTHCDNATWVGYYQACLDCALEFDTWKIYGNGSDYYWHICSQGFCYSSSVSSSDNDSAEDRVRDSNFGVISAEFNNHKWGYKMYHQYRRTFAGFWIGVHAPGDVKPTFYEWKWAEMFRLDWFNLRKIMEGLAIHPAFDAREEEALTFEREKMTAYTTIRGFLGSKYEKEMRKAGYGLHLLHGTYDLRGLWVAIHRLIPNYLRDILG